MTARVVPMIHVPDVRATAAWYLSIGFLLKGWHACDGDEIGTGPLPADMPLDWARLTFGESHVMFNAGGRPSAADRREVDLYVQLTPGDSDESVDAVYARLKDRVDVVAAPYDAFHGNRELIIRDVNRFWITFAQSL